MDAVKEVLSGKFIAVKVYMEEIRKTSNLSFYVFLEYTYKKRLN